MKKICANCVYFHPEEHEEEFGGCGVTFNHEKRAFCDSCIDFDRFDIVYTDYPTRGECLTLVEIDVLMHLKRSIGERL